MLYQPHLFQVWERHLSLNLKIALCYKIIQHLFIFLFSIIWSPLSHTNKSLTLSPWLLKHSWLTDWLYALRTIRIWPPVLPDTHWSSSPSPWWCDVKMLMGLYAEPVQVCTQCTRAATWNQFAFVAWYTTVYFSTEIFFSLISNSQGMAHVLIVSPHQSYKRGKCVRVVTFFPRLTTGYTGAHCVSAVAQSISNALLPIADKRTVTYWRCRHWLAKKKIIKTI